ncbi:hypothetical protein AeMF1_013588 [Aphanomyces euteiches]|nr:hypothetical protein AeMF1_013588 [Aphanomyces euteiches]KAH9181952.1 hypothetical protein AeNC1_016073 [Aphanomyces euteiches]
MPTKSMRLTDASCSRPLKEQVRENAKHRKQLQRARERAEKDCLKVQVAELQRQMQRLLYSKSAREMRFKSVPDEIRAAILLNRRLIRDNKSMRAQLEEIARVLPILSWWVVGPRILHLRANTKESALLAHPECRKYCLQWLREKVFNMALVATPDKPSPFDMQDRMMTTIHLGEDAAGTSLDAIQLRSHFTVHGNYRDVAQVLWRSYFQSSPPLSVQTIDLVRDGLLYFSIEYGPLKSTQLNLAGWFDVDDRIIVTYSTIAYDERFPIGDGECRIHGFGWMILDKVDERVTRCQQSRLIYTPVNKDRPLTLEEIGRVVNYELRPGENRDIIIDKFQGMVEDGYEMHRDCVIRANFPTKIQ